MQSVFWFIGKSFEAVGVISLPLALYVGVMGDNQSLEYMIAGIGIIVFFLGVAIRTTLGGDRG